MVIAIALVLRSNQVMQPSCLQGIYNKTQRCRPCSDDQGVHENSFAVLEASLGLWLLFRSWFMGVSCSFWRSVLIVALLLLLVAMASILLCWKNFCWRGLDRHFRTLLFSFNHRQLTNNTLTSILLLLILFLKQFSFIFNFCFPF